MKLIQVRHSLYKIIPTRRAETGQILAGDVLGRNDQFIAESGRPIDESLLEKFENFDVKRVQIREYLRVWLPNEYQEKLSSEIDIINTREVTDDLSIAIRGLFSEYPEAEMLRLLDGLSEEFETSEAERAIEEYVDEIRELKKDIKQLRTKVKSLENAPQERLLTILSGTSLDIQQNFLNLPIPNKILRNLLTAIKSRDRLRSGLIDIFLKKPEAFSLSTVFNHQKFKSNLIEDVLNKISSRTTDEDKRINSIRELRDEILDMQSDVLRELPVQQTENDESFNPEKFHEREIMIDPDTVSSFIKETGGDVSDKVNQLLKKRREFQKKLTQLMDQTGLPLSDLDGPQETSEKTDPIREIINKFENGQEVEAVESALSLISQKTDELSHFEGKLISYGEEFEKITNLKQELSSEIEDSDMGSENNKYLLDVIEGNEEFDTDRLLEMNIDMMIVEKIENYLKSYDKLASDFRDILWEIKSKI